MKFEELVNAVNAALSDLGAEVSTRGTNVVEVKVPVEKVVDAAKKLREMGFDHVKAVTAVDYPKERFEVIYTASSYSNLELARFFVNLRVDLPYDDPRMPSLIEIWPSAQIQEQEENEQMGILFEGNPRMGQRLLLPPDWDDIPPLRKEFKVKVEGINA